MRETAAMQFSEPDAERELIAAAGSGAEWAWRAIFDQHYVPIYRFLRSRVSTAQTAEDLASDVFLEAYRSFGSFSWRGKPVGAWLFGIARHVLASHYRKSPTVQFVDVGDVDLPSTRPEFLDIEVREILERLEPAHRLALELSYVLGLTGEEAAAVMGRTHGAYRSLLLRARQAFRSESDGRDRADQTVTAQLDEIR